MQLIRIYHARGGLAHSFRPFFCSKEALAEIECRYPEGNGFLWLR